METPLQLTRELFIDCNWSYDVSAEEHYGYSSVTSELTKRAQEMVAANRPKHANILRLLARAASMILTPSSLNEPFKARFQHFQAGKRSTQPDDFTVEELAFFASILNDIKEPWLKARLADLLWLLGKPRSPDYARIAIDSYIVHEINDKTWHRDARNKLERAARLSMQLRDNDRLAKIKNKIFSAFMSGHQRNMYMTLWIADLLDQLKVDHDYKEDIARALYNQAGSLKESGDFHAARSYYDLAARKYHQCSSEQNYLESLVAIAECFELEADSRASGSNMVANSFYEDAIQAYRRVPTKNRAAYDIDEKISIIRNKITESGQATLDEMSIVETPGVDVSEIAQSSMQHVSKKQSAQEALMYFSGLYGGPKYHELANNAKETIRNSIFSSLAGSNHMSSDGRVIAKTPPMNLSAGDDDPANQAVLHHHIQQQFLFELQLVVKAQIIPALNQLLIEHRFKKELLMAACRRSPIVPEHREDLLGHALWLGFEYEFGAAIHLLCPQLEHIVRSEFKSSGVHTSTIDKDGIENESGLSTLMDFPEAVQLFGQDLAFEIRSVFTDSIGSNLRNEAAHGLLDDNTSSSVATVYAWWMVLRLVIRSIALGDIKNA